MTLTGLKKQPQIKTREAVDGNRLPLVFQRTKKRSIAKKLKGLVFLRCGAYYSPFCGVSSLST